MNKAVFSIQMRGAKRENIDHLFMKVIMLFQEVMEWTHPSQTMNKAVFSKYNQACQGRKY